MTEELVTFETAKLLKAVGFKEDVSIFYGLMCEEGSYEYELFESYKAQNYNAGVYSFSAPTLYIAQKWLREVKGICVWIEPVIGRKWKISFCDFNVPVEESDWIENEVNEGNGYPVYDTYEEALEAGIQEALKLI